LTLLVVWDRHQPSFGCAAATLKRILADHLDDAMEFIATGNALVEVQ
jgi:hypothetical protein